MVRYSGIETQLDKLGEDPSHTILSRRLISLIAAIPEQQDRARYYLELGYLYQDTDPVEIARLAYGVYRSGEQTVASLHLLHQCLIHLKQNKMAQKVLETLEQAKREMLLKTKSTEEKAHERTETKPLPTTPKKTQIISGEETQVIPSSELMATQITQNNNREPSVHNTEWLAKAQKSLGNKDYLETYLSIKSRSLKTTPLSEIERQWIQQHWSKVLHHLGYEKQTTPILDIKDLKEACSNLKKI